MAALAAEWLDETLLTLLSADSNLPPVAKPIIGIMESYDIDLLEEMFEPLTHYPALKFVLKFPEGDKKEGGGDDEEDSESAEDDVEMEVWDFIGPRESAQDLYDSVLMYWYRFVVSNGTPNELHEAPIFTFSSRLQMTSFLEGHGESLLRPAQAKRRHQSKLESELFDFYMGQNEGVGGVFHNFEFVVGAESHKINDFIQEIDPYTLLVQCRSGVDYGTVDLDGSNKMTVQQMIDLEMQQRACNDFDELAEEMFHRRDVAFFALNTTMHNEEIADTGCDGLFGGVEGAGNGAVAFLRAKRYVTYSLSDDPVEADRDDEKRNPNIWSQHRRRVIHDVKTDWDAVKKSPHAIFVPTATKIPDEQKEIHGKSAVKDPMVPIEYVESELAASTVVHTTPTVMWFDRDRIAQLAFPWYRKVHAVLFVDIALTNKVWQPNTPQTPTSMTHPTWPSSLNYSNETAQLLLKQQWAIQMFYNAARRHRAKRPTEDVVFLIVPSSEVGILTAFGVDIWTPLDEALFGTLHEERSNNVDNEGFDQSSSTSGDYCSLPDGGDNQSILPVMMITDSSGRSGWTQSRRFYLCSKDIFSSSPIAFDEGGAMVDFLSGTIGKSFTRSEAPIPTSTKSMTVDDATDRQTNNKPNVTVITGNTFESFVMDRIDEHSMLLLHTYTCGHCKRFSIFWNEFAALIQAMNWSRIINVMKIDVSKNDVPHKKVNAWDLPSVYYFPAQEKDAPIELTPLEGKTNPQNDYDEGLDWVKSGYDLVKWLLDQGKLDLEELLQLDRQQRPAAPLK